MIYEYAPQRQRKNGRDEVRNMLIIKIKRKKDKSITRVFIADDKN